MSDLPERISTVGWTWELFVTKSFPSYKYWVGTDRAGNRWLTKLKGSFYGYREIVFAKLAQTMKWSCQSSVFLTLDKASATTLGVNQYEPQAGHWFLTEHRNSTCSPDCALGVLFSNNIITAEVIISSKVSHILDWPKSDFAAYLFGSNEPCGRLFTTKHEFVIIDSEQMFSTGPNQFDSAYWWNEPSGRPSSRGRALAAEVCSEFLSLTDDEIRQALQAPKGIQVTEKWPIAPILSASRKFASAYITSHRI